MVHIEVQPCSRTFSLRAVLVIAGSSQPGTLNPQPKPNTVILTYWILHTYTQHPYTYMYIYISCIYIYIYNSTHKDTQTHTHTLMVSHHCHSNMKWVTERLGLRAFSSFSPRSIAAEVCRVPSLSNDTALTQLVATAQARLASAAL